MQTPIIHWHTHWERNQPIFQGYARLMDSLQSQINENYLQSKFAFAVKKTYNLNSQNALAVLRAAKLFNSDGDFKKAFDAAFEQFAVMKPFSQYGLREKDFKKITKENASKIESYLEGVRKGYESIAQYLGMKNVSAFYKAIATKQNVEEVRAYFNELFDKKKIGIIELTRFQELDASAQGKLRSIAAYYKDMNITRLKNKNSGPAIAAAITKHINAGMRQIIGFGWESIISQLNSNVLPKALGPNAKLEGYGDTTSNSDFEYKRATTDIRFHGGLGQIKLTLPLGASVKVAKEGENRTHMSIKSSAGLGKMLDMLNASFGFMDNQQYEAFTNLVTNFRKPDVKSPGEYRKTTIYKDGKAFEYQNMSNLLKKLNKVLLITGLSGSLTTNDISTLFIVNNRILNIYDILGEVGKKGAWENAQVSKGLTFKEVRAISKQHHYKGEELSIEDQKERSEEINDILRNHSLDLKLNLSRTLLEKLSKI